MRGDFVTHFRFLRRSMMEAIWKTMYDAATAVQKNRIISDYVEAGGVAAAILSESGRIFNVCHLLFAFSGIYTPWLCPKRIGRCPYALAEIIFCMIITLKDNSETPSCRPPSLLFILQRYIKLGITPKEITTFLKVFSE